MPRPKREARRSLPRDEDAETIRNSPIPFTLDGPSIQTCEADQQTQPTDPTAMDVDDTPQEQTQESPTDKAEDLSALGQKSRQLIQSIQRLEALSIDSTLPSLPKIVVCGDQSAGKSSVIEAICDISMPRASGTCTRCPFEITTSRNTVNESWSCDVSLKTKYLYSPTSKNGRYPCWEEQDIVVTPFDRVCDKSELQKVLRRAQLAILNPRNNPLDYKHIDPDVETKLQNHFSPNVIHLGIRGPGLPELSFYDLPGAITVYNNGNNLSSDDGDEDVVEFVQMLTQEFINDEKALILLACAANQDILTVQSIRYVTKVKAQDRTLVVMTKSDLLEAHHFKEVEKHITANIFRFAHGFYYTKQLSQDQLDQGVRHDEALALEQRFFNEPGSAWTKAPLVGENDRFGVTNLRNKLSELLTKQIRAMIPEIIRRVHVRLDEVREELQQLPRPIASPVVEVVGDIDQVNAALSRELSVDSQLSSFRKDYRDVFRKLKATLRELCPEVVHTTPGYVPKVRISDNGGDEGPSEQSPAKSRKHNAGHPVNDETGPSTPSRTERANTVQTPQSRQSVARKKPVVVVPPQSKTIFRLEDVKSMLDSSPGADLPGQTSPHVTRALIRQATESWSEAIAQSIAQLENQIIKIVNDKVDDVLKHRQGMEIRQQLHKIVRTLLDGLFGAVQHIVSSMAEAEKYRPISYAEDKLKTERLEKLRTLREHRANIRVTEYTENFSLINDREMQAAQQNKLRTDKAEQMRILGHDQFDRELEALAMPLAYYSIASMRVIDQIALIFEYEVMYKLEQQLVSLLRTQLKIDDAQYCAWLLVEDEGKERQRVRLMAEENKLEEAVKELSVLMAAM